MVSAANGLLSNISNLNITLLDGPPPPYGGLQQPVDSFMYTGLCICSSLRGCGPKDIHEKENRRREEGKHTFQLAFSKIAQRHVISIKTQLNVTFRRPFWKVTYKRNIPPERGAGNILRYGCKDHLCIMTNAVCKEIH